MELAGTVERLELVDRVEEAMGERMGETTGTFQSLTVKDSTRTALRETRTESTRKRSGECSVTRSRSSRRSRTVGQRTTVSVGICLIDTPWNVASLLL